MPLLEERLQQRFPTWFRGRRGQVARPLLRGVARWSRFDAIEDFLQRAGHLRDAAFLDATLEFLDLRYDMDAACLAAIPKHGRLLIVANHPSGALDALALLHAVGRVRGDVRIVANEVLSMLGPMAGLLLPVQVFGGRADPESLRAVEQALQEEQCVIVFPAGEVSRLGPQGVRDRRWRKGFAHFARRTGAPVLPVRIAARNSALFYGTSAVFKPAATALLAREMFARRGRPLRLHVGTPMHIDPRGDIAGAIREVRDALYRLGREQPWHAFKSAVDVSAAAEPVTTAFAAPIAAAIDADTLRQAIAVTELLGSTADGKQIRLLDCEAATRAPRNRLLQEQLLQEHLLQEPLLQELGRLRELTFRKVGEGTGLSRDLDAFDAHYQHVLVWDDDAGRIAGAYRIARGARVLARHGLAGLYTASLFRYTDDAIPRIAEGMELGRSFVAPEYWGGRSLDYLWQGIGAYLRRYPGVRYLFGAVSISAALPVAAREQIVAYYQRYYGETVVDSAHTDRGYCQAGIASALRPFAYFAAPPSFGDMDAGTAFEVMKANLAALGSSVPMLYKQYTELCEPGGVRFLAFGVDPAFSDSIDGLIEVDLQRMQPRKHKRYLQAGGVAA